MDVKPGDIFVGILDFFSIIMPGAVVVFAISPWCHENVFNGGVLPTINTEAHHWVAFGFASYFVGHCIFLIGSQLDEPVYDKRFRRHFARKSKDQAFEVVREMKEAEVNLVARGSRPATEPADKSLQDAVNVYKWAGAVLRLAHSDALSEIRRLEADSKFFRSFAVVLAGFTAYFAFARQDAGPTVVFAALTGLSCYRYAEQRWKTIELTYQYFMAMRHAKLDAAKG